MLEGRSDLVGRAPLARSPHPIAAAALSDDIRLADAMRLVQRSSSSNHDPEVTKRLGAHLLGPVGRTLVNFRVGGRPPGRARPRRPPPA